MTDGQIISKNIKTICKEKNIALKDMLSDLGLGINFISQTAKSNNITYTNLVKISDYLKTDVDNIVYENGINPNAITTIKTTKTFNDELLSSLLLTVYNVSSDNNTKTLEFYKNYSKYLELFLSMRMFLEKNSFKSFKNAMKNDEFYKIYIELITLYKEVLSKAEENIDTIDLD